MASRDDSARSSRGFGIGGSRSTISGRPRCGQTLPTAENRDQPNPSSGIYSTSTHQNYRGGRGRGRFRPNNSSTYQNRSQTDEYVVQIDIIRSEKTFLFPHLANVLVDSILTSLPGQPPPLLTLRQRQSKNRQTID